MKGVHTWCYRNKTYFLIMMLYLFSSNFYRYTLYLPVTCIVNLTGCSRCEIPESANSNWEWPYSICSNHSIQKRWMNTSLSIHDTGLSKVAGCWQKSPPTMLYHLATLLASSLQRRRHFQKYIWSLTTLWYYSITLYKHSKCMCMSHSGRQNCSFFSFLGFVGSLEFS